MNRPVGLTAVLSLFISGVFLLATGFADDWTQWQGNQRDGIWRETGVLADFSAGQPQVVWRVPVAGGYSGPAVAAGRVFLTDYVRSEGDASPSPDKRNVLQGRERVLCFDQAKGTLIWKHEYPRTYKISYPAGPRATPLVDGPRVYTLGAEGDLICLRVTDGQVIWSRNLADEYGAKSPIWGHAAHPLLDGDRLICLAGGEGTAAVALDKMTGKEVWRSLSTPNIGYAPPTMIQAGGRRQLLIWHSRSLNSLDPATGKLLWDEALEPDYEMSIAPPLKSDKWLYVGAIKNKCMALELDANSAAAKLLWKGKNKVGVGPSHCPVVADVLQPHIAYGVDRGGLRCIDLRDGRQLWEDFSLMETGRRSNAGTIFITPHVVPGETQHRYFLFSETGELAIAQLTAGGYKEIGRTKALLKPTHNAFGRDVLWSAPAYADRAMFVRNDDELIRVSLSAK